jgi:streptogramin lyase
MITFVLALVGCIGADDPKGPGPGTGPTDGPTTDTAEPPDTGTPPTEPDPWFTATLSDTNRITLEWSIPGAASGDEVYVFDLGLAPAVCAEGPSDGCAIEARVEDGGVHEFTLRIPAVGEPATFLSAEVEVIPPAPPQITADAPSALSSGGNTVTLDLLAPSDVTLQWDESARPAGTFLRLRTPETSPFVDGVEVGLVDGVVVPAEDLSRLGTSSWTLEACTLPPGADVPLCSIEAPLSLSVVAGHLEGRRRVQVDPAADHNIDWQSAGDLFLVTAETLGIDAWVAGPPFTIPADQLVPGVHEVTIVPCRLDTGVCANRWDAAATQAGTVSYPHPLLEYGDVTLALEGMPVADVDTGNGVETLVAPYTGTVLEVVPEGGEVEAGEVVFAILTGDGVRQQLVVGDGVEWELDRPWSEDFASGAATASWPREGAGSPLDVAIEADGDAWVNSEFTRRLFHVRPDGTGEALTFPLLHRWDAEAERYVPVRPFANPLSGASPSDASAYGEKVEVAPDGTVWATLGGVGFHEGGDVPNHSRLLRFDPAGVDLDTTLHDDRFCAYAVPGDGNGVVGLDVDGDRVWFVESTRMVLSVFEPRPEHCEPLLDYEDPAALAASSLQVCVAGQTVADGCVEQVLLGDGIHPAHVEIDPADGTAWVTDAFGNWLLHYLPATGQVEAFELPLPALRPHFFQGFPWQLRVTADAVYLGEYGDVSLVRFDKAAVTMDEIAVPFTVEGANLHSIDIDDQDRLWFTLSAEGFAQVADEVSTIGYVDLAAWRAGAPTGVVYAGLADIVDPAHPDVAASWAPCFRGVDVAPGGQRIVLGSMRREETVVLTFE